MPQCAIGVDCGGGGKDSTIIALRHDGWYDNLIELKGSETPNGEGIGGRVASIRKDNSEVVIDAGGGYGNLPMREIRNNSIPVTAYKGPGRHWPHGRRTIRILQQAFSGSLAVPGGS